MNIAVGCDHAGYELKERIIQYLSKLGLEPIDMGAPSSESVDYPDFAHPLSSMVNEGKLDFGILICGSGNGVSITANKYANVRCALCWNNSIASLARQHNNANVIAIPSRFVSTDEALEMVDIFLDTDFEGGRHQRRIDKIAKTKKDYSC